MPTIVAPATRSFWRWLHDASVIMHETRFSLVVVLLAGGAFIANDQAKDLLLGLKPL